MTSAMKLLFSCALIAHDMQPGFSNSWVAEAMGVKFLAQGNNSSRKPQLKERIKWRNG